MKNNPHLVVVIVLCLLIVAAIALAPCAERALVRRVQAGCDDGTLDPGICLMADAGGLLNEPVPDVSAEAAR